MAEESWSDPGAAVSKHGRLFEVTNPLADAADIDFVHRDILPRVLHEGLAFDSSNNLYFIDECKVFAIDLPRTRVELSGRYKSLIT